MYDSMYDRKNLLNKAILMKKELWLLKKNHGYSIGYDFVRAESLIPRRERRGC